VVSYWLLVSALAAAFLCFLWRFFLPAPGWAGLALPFAAGAACSFSCCGCCFFSCLEAAGAAVLSLETALTGFSVLGAAFSVSESLDGVCAITSGNVSQSARGVLIDDMQSCSMQLVWMLHSYDSYDSDWKDHKVPFTGAIEAQLSVPLRRKPSRQKSELS